MSQSYTLTPSQQTAIDLINEKIVAAQVSVNQARELGFAYLKQVLTEAGKDSSLAWIFEPNNYTLLIPEDPEVKQ